MLKELRNSPIGHLVSIGRDLEAYVPDPLPRQIDLDAPLIYQLDAASRAVATLDGVGEIISNPHLLTAPFMRREAVLSSRIEGTQASLSDLLMYEASSRPRGDVLEVYNYVDALEEGLGLLDSLPISLRFVNRLHGTLMSGVRGQGKRPGEIRGSQVHIESLGTPIEEARYIPPPPRTLLDLIGDWEHFANEDLRIPALVQCALLHYQFEAIHPYLDGNGRIGRLLITLFLQAKGVLRTPLLYLSAYFDRERKEYYDQLFRVSSTGDWSVWLDYFLRGVEEQAKDALSRARQVRRLYEKYKELLQNSRESGNALLLLDVLFTQPYMTAPFAAEELDITRAGARGILDRLTDTGILRAVPHTWPHLFVAWRLLEIIDASSAIEP